MSQTQNVAQLKYSVLFEKSPIPVILSKMPDARVVETNEAFLSLYEFTRSEVMGKTSLELGIASLVDHREVRSRLSQFGHLKDYECVRHSKTGRELHILLNVNFIDIAGEKHVLTTIVDQTRQKKIEEDLRLAQAQASEASRLKSEFLAGMSHEIRTPLSIVLGFSEMITKSVHSLEQAQKYAGRILQSSKHLKSLIDDVLDLSKIEAGKVHLDKTTFSFERMLDDELALLKSFAEQKGLYFKVNKFRLPSMLSTDATRFRQILNNVIGNAIKYTESGGVTIDVDLETHLEIAVHDTGIGISEASKDKVFKTFERGDKSTLRRFGGTGLGLVLAKKLAQALGGDVILRQSQEQQGSTFVITIDPGSNDRQAVAPTVDVDPSFDCSKDFAGIKILSVEDNPDIRLIIAAIFQNMLINVDFARDGEEGYVKASKNFYDLVLMDIQLPKMSGIEVTRKLRAEGFQVPIVAVTAHVLKSEHEQYLKSGFNDCLSKPFGTQSLLKIFQANLKDKYPPETH